MPTPAARTQTVETKTTRVEALSDGRPGLGMKWDSYLASIDEDQLDLTNVKIYRLGPDGFKGFIEKIGWGTEKRCERIDEHWIRDRFGGGIYGVRIDTKGGASGYERDVTIAGMAKPIGISQSSAGASSSDSSVIEKLMEQNQKLLERLVDAKTPAVPEQPGLSAAIGVVAQGAKEAISMMAAVPKGETKSQTETLTETIALIDKLRPPQAPPQENPLVQKLLAATIERMLGAAAPAAIAAPDPLAQITQLTSLIDAIDKLRGGGEAGALGRDWKAMLVEKGIDKIPELLTVAKEIVQSRERETQIRANAAIRLRQIATATGAPAAAPGAEPPAPGAPAAPALDVTPRAAEPAAVETVAGPHGAQVPISPPGTIPVGPNDVWIRAKIVEMIANNSPGDRIVDVIDEIAPAVGALLSNASAEDIRKFFAADPILNQALALENFDSALAEVLAYIHDEDGANAESAVSL